MAFSPFNIIQGQVLTDFLRSWPVSKMLFSSPGHWYVSYLARHICKVKCISWIICSPIKYLLVYLLHKLGLKLTNWCIASLCHPSNYWNTLARKDCINISMAEHLLHLVALLSSPSCPLETRNSSMSMGIVFIWNKFHVVNKLYDS